LNDEQQYLASLTHSITPSVDSTGQADAGLNAEFLGIVEV
jgi:hypothetical protein